MTFAGYVEAGDGTELPLPWDPSYKESWKTFLKALAARYGSDPVLVSIAVAGPTAGSVEMILPHDANTPPQFTDRVPGGVQPDDIWRQLLCFQYPDRPQYHNTDQAFVDEWNAAIDTYGGVFQGVTLVATTGNGLPNLGRNSLTIPSPLAAACASPPSMDCAAEATILAHLMDPAVGGANAKATQESGMEASRTGSILGIVGVKLVSSLTASATTPSAQVLGGSQFNSAFSPSTTRALMEGCTCTFPPHDLSDTSAECGVPGCDLSCGGTACLPVACVPPACLAPGITQADLATFPTFGQVPAQDLIPPEQALYNVLRRFFDGTPAGAAFGATAGDAPLNYLQIYSPDIQYAEEKAGSPAQVVQTSGASIAVTAQTLLEEARTALVGIAEPTAP